MAYASLIGASPMEKSIVKNVKTKADENNPVFNKNINNHLVYKILGTGMIFYLIDFVDCE